MKINRILIFGTIALAFLVALVYWKVQKDESYNKPMKIAFEAIESEQYDKAFSILKPLADGGYPSAQHWLAIMHAEGLGREKNDQEAIRLFKLSSHIYPTCKELKEPASATVFAIARDFERVGKAEDASRWYKYAEEMGYDEKLCPLPKIKTAK